MNSMLQHNSVLSLSPQQQQCLAASGKGRELLEAFRSQALTPLFQPIIDLKQRCIFAHEALIRGPKNSYLHSSLNLLQVAEEHGCLFEIDWLARLLSIHSFQHQRARSLLFLNVTVNTIMQKTHRSGITLEYLQLLGIPVEQVVIEITELQPVEDFHAFIESVNHYRDMGFKVAVDDLGAGYNGLRIWSELRPDFVKIDHHFVSGIDSDDDKYHFMETLCQLARQLDTCIIAEGVERIEELQSLEILGVDYVQGFLLQRPQETISQQLDFDWNLLLPAASGSEPFPALASLCQQPFVINQDFNLMQVARFYFANPDIEFSPVVINERICGMIWRDQLMMHIARSLEYNSNPNQHISALIDNEAVIIAADTGLLDAARILACTNGHRRNQAFIISEHGHYSGCATMACVLEKILEISAAPGLSSNFHLQHSG